MLYAMKKKPTHESHNSLQHSIGLKQIISIFSQSFLSQKKECHSYVTAPYLVSWATLRLEHYAVRSLA